MQQVYARLGSISHRRRVGLLVYVFNIGRRCLAAVDVSDHVSRYEPGGHQGATSLTEGLP